MSNIRDVRGPFTRIEYHPIELNSHDQVKKYLLSVGWKPTKYNRTFDKVLKKWRTTSPKLTEDSFGSIQSGVGKLIARRNIIIHRRRTILNYKDPENKGILACLRPDGRVPAEGITCNTPTARTTHRHAVCNIPKAKDKIPYGIEMRSLFCVKPPYIMLGADLDGIEARITAHHAWAFDGGNYWRVLQECGDIHQYNADRVGIDRDTAKSFQYSLFYGAQAPKVASTVGCSLKEAERLVKLFWENNKGVYDLNEYVKKYYKKFKFLKGLDGRKLFVRAEYKCLNTLIQSSAAIVFKVWSNVANRKLADDGIDCSQIISLHDENDYRCHPDCKDEAIKIIEESTLEAGRLLGMRVPITSTVKVGMNWAQIH